MDQESRKQLVWFARMSQVGIQFAVWLLLGYFGCGYLGDYLDIAWLSWAGLAVGFAIGGWTFVRFAREARASLEPGSSALESETMLETQRATKFRSSDQTKHINDSERQESQRKKQ